MHKSWAGVEILPGWSSGKLHAKGATGDETVVVGAVDDVMGYVWRYTQPGAQRPTTFTRGWGWTRLEVVRALIADGANIPHERIDDNVYPNEAWLADREAPAVETMEASSASTSPETPTTVHRNESPWITLAHEMGNVLYPLQHALERMAPGQSEETREKARERALRCLERLWAANDVIRAQAHAAVQAGEGHSHG